MSAISLVLILSLEPWLRDALYEASHKIISDIQSPTVNVKSWYFFSNAGVLACLVVPLIHSGIITRNRAQFLYYVQMVSTEYFIMMVGKLWYSSPRPFWTGPEVKAWGCSPDFGNPSGHSLFSMSLCLTFYLSLYSQLSRIQKVIGGFLSVSISLAIAFSRILLGVHSLNQVIFGLVIGIWATFTFHFCVRKPFFSHIKNLSDSTSKLMLLASVYIFAVAIVCVIYESTTPYIDPIWVKHISEKCSVEKLAHSFQHQGVNVIGVMTMGVGSYHGQVVERRTYRDRHFVNTQAWKILLKIILILVFFIPVFIGNEIEKQASNRYLIMVFAHGIPYYTSFYLSQAYFEQVCFQLGLIKLGPK